MYTLGEQNYIDSKVNNQGKNGLIAWLLWFFIGSIGAHRFYLGKIGSGVAMALTTFFISPFFFFLPTLVWIVIDAILINSMVREENDRVRHVAEQEVHSMR